MSLIDVPAGHLAAVVTYLEMKERPAGLTVPPSPLELRRIAPSRPAYRDLFRAVGAPWLWFSRLIMRDSALRAIIDHPGVEVFEVRDGDRAVGMLELDRRVAGECELSFVGLIPAYAGQGHGRWLLAEAVTRAWRGFDAVELERRGRDDQVSPAVPHLEVSDDRCKVAGGNVDQAHAQRASGGRLIKIASILPPVLSPNKVPRS